MKDIFRIFMEVGGKRSVTVIVLLTIASFFQSFGIVNVLPALNFVLEGNALDSPVTEALNGMLLKVGLTPRIRGFYSFGPVGYSTQSGYSSDCYDICRLYGGRAGCVIP